MSDRFPDLPARMRALPVDRRGFPVPWFVAWIDGEPHFPIADGAKLVAAVRHNRCWVCGEPMGRIKAFTIGPMCAVNRTSSEPPAHLDCARFSARNCPFLTKPNMKRVGEHLHPHGVEEPGGTMIKRNPGVTLVWQTLRYEPWDAGGGKVLFDIGKCHAANWYAHGRTATRDEVLESIRTGIPLLEAEADKDPLPGAHLELARMIARAMTEFPA
jgi:hypothetical protein